jgi:hypothetical protein
MSAYVEAGHEPLWARPLRSRAHIASRRLGTVERTAVGRELARWHGDVRNPVSSSRHITRSVRIPALRVPAHFTSRVIWPVGSAFAWTQSLRLRSCSLIGALSCHPCLPCWPRRAVQQGPFAPRELPRFFATTSLTTSVPPSADFPMSPVIRPTLLHRWLGGTRTVSPVARHVLATVLSLPPCRSDMPPRSARGRPCCFRPTLEGSARSHIFFDGDFVSELFQAPDVVTS